MQTVKNDYRQTSNSRHAIGGNEHVVHPVWRVRSAGRIEKTCTVEWSHCWATSCRRRLGNLTLLFPSTILLSAIHLLYERSHHKILFFDEKASKFDLLCRSPDASMKELKWFLKELVLKNCQCSSLWKRWRFCGKKNFHSRNCCWAT